MNYDKIGERIIASAVKNHLRRELKEHCQKVAKTKATAWLKKNTKTLADAIGKAVDKRLDAEKGLVVKLAAKAVTVHAPVKRRGW